MKLHKNAHTPFSDIIPNPSPQKALSQIKAPRVARISIIPEEVLKTRDPRIYLKRKLPPLPQEETAEDMDISYTPPPSPIHIILDSPLPPTK